MIACWCRSSTTLRGSKGGTIADPIMLFSLTMNVLSLGWAMATGLHHIIVRIAIIEN